MSQSTTSRRGRSAAGAGPAGPGSRRCAAPAAGWCAGRPAARASPAGNGGSGAAAWPGSSWRITATSRASSSGRERGEVPSAEPLGGRGQRRKGRLGVRLVADVRRPADPSAWAPARAAAHRGRRRQSARRGGGAGSAPARNGGAFGSPRTAPGRPARGRPAAKTRSKVGISAGSATSVASPHQYSSRTVRGSASVDRGGEAGRALRSHRQPLGPQPGREPRGERGEVGAVETSAVGYIALLSIGYSSPSTLARPASRAAARSSSYLSTAPSVRSAAPTSQVDDAERLQRGGPADRLGDPGRLVEVERAQPLDGRRRPLGQRTARAGHPAADDLGHPVRGRGSGSSGTGSAASARRAGRGCGWRSASRPAGRWPGGCPAPGSSPTPSAEQLEQERLELVVGPVDLVDQQHRPARARVVDRGQQRPGAAGTPRPNRSASAQRARAATRPAGSPAAGAGSSTRRAPRPR